MEIIVSSKLWSLNCAKESHAMHMSGKGSQNETRSKDHNLKESPALSSTIQYSMPKCKQHPVSYCTGAHVSHMPHCTGASLQPCNHFRTMDRRYLGYK